MEGNQNVERIQALSDVLEAYEHGESLFPPTPPVAALRAFEAVARRRSFTRAAIELSQTQTAISHQVRKLESLLGVSLFVRSQSGIELTEEGAQLLPAVQDSLGMLTQAIKRIKDRQHSEELSVVTLAAFGIKCLLPHLADFRERFPYVRLRIKTVISFSASHNYLHDIAFRYGTGNWNNVTAVRVTEETLTPVCSPKFLAAYPIESVHDFFEQVPLILTESSAFSNGWDAWFAANQIRPPATGNVIICDNMLSAIQAAIDGLGVTLGRRPLITADLAANNLVAPFANEIRGDSAYYMTIAKGSEDRRLTREFMDWFCSLGIC